MTNASGRTVVRISVVNGELYVASVGALVGFFFFQKRASLEIQGTLFFP